MRMILVSIAFVFLFFSAANALSKSVVGTVDYYSVGNRGNWEAIDLVVGNKKYMVYLLGVNIPSPKIVGKVREVGRKVRVSYSRIVSEQGYDGRLVSNRVIEVKR